ncbi:MAG: hypothetical protein QG559_769 [Campylobacterota bacterium]|nr:hypothetical protein [Campylobacterota bacterium]
MHLKKYTIASLILILLVGWYVYAFITQEALAINFFGTDLPSLSIATWVIAPLILFYLASVLHMAFYSFKNSMRTRKFDKDFEKIVDAMVDAYLGKENRTHNYKTDRYKLLGELVDNSIVFPAKNFDATIENKKISDVLSVIGKIKDGEVVELKKYSLPSSNELVIQNERNRYKKGEITAEAILSHSNRYDAILCKEVFVDFVKKAPLKAIERYKNFLTKESLFEILSRINAYEDTLIIDNDTLIAIFKDLKLTSKDYIDVSRKLSKSMIPEQRMKLFETLSNENDAILEAYLYTLFDLEMLTMAREILNGSNEREYSRFKIYSALRECGKHYHIDLFL